MQKSASPVNMVELWRGTRCESVHAGHAVVWGPGGVVRSWGDPASIMFPRSSCKMIQALPLLETGVCDRLGLSDRHLALACASHQGAASHIELAGRWLADLGLSQEDLRCGVHEPADRTERDRLIRGGESPCQLHNNCSGKHCGFLSVNQHLRADSEYVDIDHPLQKMVRTTTEELCDETVSGYGIDGCSAPNFAVSLAGLARAMHAFAAAREGGNRRQSAMARLRDAMIRHPDLVAGQGRACTELMHATQGAAAVKMGAEAVYVAMLPEQRLGVALKIVDGGLRAADAAIVAILADLGVLDPNHPAALKRVPAPQKSWRGIPTGELRLASDFLG